MVAELDSCAPSPVSRWQAGGRGSVVAEARVSPRQSGYSRSHMFS